MAVCCCSLAGTAACQHCSQNPFATDVWTNKTVTVDHIDATPFGNGLDVCPVCGKPSTIGKPQTNADRIRAMTDEELYKFIVGIYSLMTDQYGEPDYRLVVDGNQFRDDESLIDWLKQEATE